MAWHTEIYTIKIQFSRCHIEKPHKPILFNDPTRWTKNTVSKQDPMRFANDNHDSLINHLNTVITIKNHQNPLVGNHQNPPDQLRPEWELPWSQ